LPARFRIVVALVLIVSSLAVANSSNQAAATALGNGRYQLTASVYGGGDGLVGNETTSGRILKTLDRLVALPACTESSCPWVGLDAGVGGRYGPQTECAEADGLCWVEVRSDETGLCAVAPVLDLGPLFVQDNWWDLKRNRTYRFNRGEPAAIAAADGADLGYGKGISDVGNDIQHNYSYAAGIDLAAGTWVDLGLDPHIGLAELRVTLLWQAGMSHYDACGGDFGNAAVTDRVNLRSGPGTNYDRQAVISGGSRISVTGGLRNGFYPSDVDGMRGWISADYIDPDYGGVGDLQGFVLDSVNLRSGPGTDWNVIQTVPDGNMVIVNGDRQNGFYPVTYRGADGWISATYLDTGARAADQAIAVTTDNVNLRSGPRTNYSIRRTIPAGTTITLTGDSRNGMVTARYDGTTGWVSAAYLSFGDTGDSKTVVDSVNFRTAPRLTSNVIQVLPEGATVIYSGEQRGGFLKVTYRGTTGWVFAAYLE
jgi:uncharacterized protein YgiM (DUF1202 family)